MALEHALLVSLSERPASGLDLARRFDKSIGFFWQASHQQIYKTLGRMEKDGWVTSTVVVQQGRPDKKVYDVSDAGRLAVQAWLATHPNGHFHFTPKGASWLNLVEAWFSILTRKSVRRGSFDTVRALIRHIERYLAEWNAHPTPFVWTKDPAAIIKKALRRGPGR